MVLKIASIVPDPIFASFKMSPLCLIDIAAIGKPLVQSEICKSINS